MSNFDAARSRLETALRLGIDVEGGEFNPLAPIVNTITEEQIRWVSTWLAGEGFDLAGTVSSVNTANLVPNTGLAPDTPCLACGAWVCADCGVRQLYWSRYRQNTPTCRNCKGTAGELQPVYHRKPMQKRHNQWYAGLRDRYPCYHPLDTTPIEPEKDGPPS